MPINERILQLEADFLKALAHPTRLRILEFLRDGEHCVCELTDQLDLVQANVSQHLAVMKRQDIISSRKEGTSMIYSVTYPEVYTLLDGVKEVLKQQASTTAKLLEAEG